VPSEDEPGTDSAWLYLIAGIGAVAAIAVGLMLFMRTRKK
jgi:LPXTG-motif cell wall-anchored protein